MTKSPEQPRDLFGEPISAPLCPSISHIMDVSGEAATRTELDFTYGIIEVRASQDTCYTLGDSSIVATKTDHFLPSGETRRFSVKDNTRISSILSASEGRAKLYISEME